MLQGISREMATERWKMLSQCGNDAQKWFYLVVKVKFNAVKKNIA